MKPDSVARFTVRGSGKPECQKRATPKPHVDMYITPHYTDSSNGEGTPLANRYSLGRVYNTPKEHSPLLCFLTFNEIYQISNRQNQSVVNAFNQKISSRPSPIHGFGTRNFAKIEKLKELKKKSKLFL